MESNNFEKLSPLAEQLNVELRKYKRIENVYYDRVTFKKLINESVETVDKYNKECIQLGGVPQEGYPTPEQCATILYNFVYKLMEKA